MRYRKGYVYGNYYKHGKHVCSQHSVKETELMGLSLLTFVKVLRLLMRMKL
ncbi:hypothetical protein K0T92_08700 [Paenibacillus oenotherae]|uniref:Transposase DDE domain-containing protein n=1 Tax=Paenibacillus oenotherae TaxID=1435645 RepID=A0ABS7D4I3_9BACL|nr:hypothetical protein [Paenibacillus oenotherae]